MATNAQMESFINTVGRIAVQVCNERGYGNAQAWTCICQAACESAYGTSKIMAGANAFFGIKANKDWVKAAKYGGLVYNTKTKECYDGKNYVSITDTFRAYRNMTDSIRDYFDLLETKRYRACLSPQIKTVQDCISIIKNSGYATSPTYISTITGIYNKHKSLIEKWTVGQKPTLKVGTTYTTTVNLYVRITPSGEKKLLSEFTANGKKSAYDDGEGHGILRKDTRVTCQDIQEIGNQIWIKIPSGYICAKNGDSYYLTM